VSRFLLVVQAKLLVGLCIALYLHSLADHLEAHPFHTVTTRNAEYILALLTWYLRLKVRLDNTDGSGYTVIDSLLCVE
jgi:hypothetical protein